MKTPPLYVSIPILLITLAGLIGYGLNIIKLMQTDFNSPYKAEVIRAVGVVLPPLGSIAGWVGIED